MRRVRLWELKCLVRRFRVGAGLPGTVLSTTPHCLGPWSVAGQGGNETRHFVWIITLLWVWGDQPSHGRFGACQTFTRAGFASIFHPRDSARREKSHPACLSSSSPSPKPSHVPRRASSLRKAQGVGVLQEMVGARLQARLSSLSHWSWEASSRNLVSHMQFEILRGKPHRDRS